MKTDKKKTKFHFRTTVSDRVYGTSERDGHYEPLQTSTEEDVIQIHNDGEIPQG